MAWDPDYIDFISEYCDRRCQRCPLTERCATFTARADPEELDDCAAAVEKAMEALRAELALPAPPAPPAENSLQSWADAGVEDGEEPARTNDGIHRIRDHYAMVEAREYAVSAFAWLELYADATRERVTAAKPESATGEEAGLLRLEAESVLDALEIVEHDCLLMPGKLFRALRGGAFDEPSLTGDPLQTDSNGSAKVTLILVERSEAAWHLIARWAPESDIARQFSRTLAALRLEIDRAFPYARRFVRPGFDDTGS